MPDDDRSCNATALKGSWGVAGDGVRWRRSFQVKMSTFEPLIGGSRVQLGQSGPREAAEAAEAEAEAWAGVEMVGVLLRALHPPPLQLSPAAA